MLDVWNSIEATTKMNVNFANNKNYKRGKKLLFKFIYAQTMLDLNKKLK